MGERLDLSGAWYGFLSDNGASIYSAEYECIAEDVLAEALRAQASEDALKERVRVLEEIIIADIIPLLRMRCEWLSVDQLSKAISGGKGEG